MACDKAPSEVDYSYRHAIAMENADTTLCGIDADHVDMARFKIACDCGHPKCEKPVTCPVCIELQKGVRN